MAFDPGGRVSTSFVLFEYMKNGVRCQEEKTMGGKCDQASTLNIHAVKC
jgi:hypothetical protein